MTSYAYYNEINPFAADWLRELIKAGHIAPGEVDTRSIEDVVPSDLAGFIQCHFFAGIGVWSYALRQAGWSDDRPVWTGSCPCQPFSAAGKGAGFADERHLWPAFHHLIKAYRPVTVFGEQVASKDGLAWFDLVQDDMEGEGYACGAVDSCAAGFGAPHIRQRLYWVAHTQHQRRDIGGVFEKRRDNHSDGGIDETGCVGNIGRLQPDVSKNRPSILRLLLASKNFRVAHTESAEYRSSLHTWGGGNRLADGRTTCGLEHTGSVGRPQGRDCDGQHDGVQLGAAINVGGLADANNHGHHPQKGIASEQDQHESHKWVSNRDGMLVRMGNASSKGLEGLSGHGDKERDRKESRGSVTSAGKPCGLEYPSAYRVCEHTPGPNNGFWRDADWLFCRDGKWRSVEPGTFPLAHGATNRVGRLRGYGNAIIAPQAQAFIEAFMSWKA